MDRILELLDPHAFGGIPNRLINYAKKETGRSSLAYELAMAIARKRKRMGKPSPVDESLRTVKLRKIAAKARSKSGVSGGGGPITTQFDYKVSRGKKRLSKRQKRWKSFVKKVHKAENANDKTHFLVEGNNGAAAVVGTVGRSLQQVFPSTAVGNDFNLQLAPVGNNASGPLLFIENLIQQKSVEGVVGLLPVAKILQDVQYRLLGASCTISWKNVTANNIFVDVYECIATQDISNVLFATARDAWINSLATATETDQLAVRQTLTSGFSGSNPYQAPGFLKYWKVVKKTRVLCGPAAKTNYTYFTKGRMIKNNIAVGKYALKGLTKDLIIIANPTYNGDTAAVNQIEVEWSKSYAVKVDDMPGLQSQWAYQIPY